MNELTEVVLLFNIYNKVNNIGFTYTGRGTGGDFVVIAKTHGRGEIMSIKTGGFGYMFGDVYYEVKEASNDQCILLVASEHATKTGQVISENNDY